MNKLFTKIAALALGATMAVGVGVAVTSAGKVANRADATEEVAYTLTPANTTSNSYAGNGTATINGVEWHVQGNGQQQPWRLGGKSISDTDRKVYSSAAVSTHNITKVVLTVGTASSVTVNSLSLNVGTTMGGSQTSTVSKTFAASSDITFDRPSGDDWSGKYFTFTFNLTITETSNKFVQFSKAVFYYEASGPTPLSTPSPTYNSSSNKVEWAAVENAVSYQVKVGSGNYATATSPYDGNFVASTQYTVYVKAIGDGSTHTDSEAGSVTFTAVAPFVGTDYTLVTAASELEAGANYIVASGTSGSVKVMSTEENTNNRRQTEVTVDSVTNMITTTSDVLVLRLGGSSNAWTFLTTNYLGTNGYLQSAESGTSNNLLVTARASESEIPNNGKFTITYSNGIPEIHANAGNRTYMRHNSGSSLFSLYQTNGTQSDVYLWKEHNTNPTITLSTSSLSVGVGLSSTFTVTSQNLTDNFTITGATAAITLNYTASKNDTQTVTVTGNSATNSPIELTVSSGSASATINVNVKSIYSVAQAFNAIDNSGDVTNVYAKGIVSTVYSYSTSNHNITFYISDDGQTTGSQLEAYRCSSSSDPDVKVGDVVTLYGNLSLYNTTHQFDAGNIIVKHSKITGLVKSGNVKTQYNAGEYFDPTNLVVTASYDNGEANHEFTYANHAGNFAFNPGLSDVLSTSVTSVSISYGHGNTTLSITVSTAPAVLNVQVSPTSQKLNFGDDFVITATVTVEGGASDAVIWSIDDNSTLVTITSSDSSSATIEANSSIAGTAVVRATSSVDPTKSATCTVKVVDPDALTDTLTYSVIGVTSGSYTPWSNVSDSTSAIYAGCSAGGANDTIQINGTASNGLYNTAYAGYIRTIVFTFHSTTSTPRTISVYGSHSVFESVSAVSGGTSLGSVTYDGTSTTLTLNIASQYEFEYFGIRAGGAVYLDEIVITYEKINTDPSIEIIGDTVLVGKEGSSDSTSTSVKVKNIVSPSFSFTFDEDGQTGKVSSSYVRVSTGTPEDNIYPLTIDFDNAGSTKVHINVSGQTTSLDVTVVEVSYVTANLPAQYRLVLDDSSLSAGDQIVIADTDKVMNSTFTNNEYAGETDVTISGGAIKNSDLPAGALVLTLGGNATDGWTLSSSGSYLTCTAVKKMKLDSTESTWESITIDSSTGNASITFDSTCGTILHNSQSTRFTTYTSAPTSSNRLPKIYRYVSGYQNVEIDSDILLALSSAESEFTCNAQGTSFDGEGFNAMSQFFTEPLKAKYFLDYADANENGNVVQQFLAMYDYAVEKYGSDYDFLGRIASGKITPSGGRVNPVIITGENSNVVAIVVIISVISISAIGGYFFLRKRREEN